MKNSFFILLVMALIGHSSASFAQQKYALLIGGDYNPGTEIPDYDKWNNGNDQDPVNGYDEFWNDTYLMWELLYDDPISNYSNDNITVLFAQGIDYTFDGQNGRYKSSVNYDIDHITDGAATKANVMSALDDLAGIEEEDYVFIWIMSNGGNTDGVENVYSYVYLWGYGPGNPDEILYDYELKEKLDLIPAHKKVVVVQAPNSSGFAFNLSDEATFIFTSSQTDQPAKRANDTPYQENEQWGGTTYHHGEFGYHLYSPLKGMDPAYNTEYGTTSFSNANGNDDDIVSLEEGLNWELQNNNSPENPYFSDIGNIAESSAIQYSTIIYEDIWSDVDYIGTIGITGPPNYPFPSYISIQSGNVSFDKSMLFFLEETQFACVGGKIILHDDISLFGYDGTSGLIIFSDFSLGKGLLFSGINGEYWGGLAIFDNPVALYEETFIDCHVTLGLYDKLSVEKCTFTRSGIIGNSIDQSLYIGENNYFINSFGHFTAYTPCVALIEDCNFSGPNIHYSNQFGIYLSSFGNYTIRNNNIQGFGSGIYINNCSSPRMDRDVYGNSIHDNSLAGIYVYRSASKIYFNPGIYDNGKGIVTTGNSNVEIYGMHQANHVSETQQIFDNETNQIWASYNSFPVYLRWNAVWKDYNEDCLIKWDIGEADPPQQDISYNSWGVSEFFDPEEDLCPTNYFNWEPIWELEYGDPTEGEGEALYRSAQLKADQEDFIGAKNDYEQLVSDYNDSKYAEAALKELLSLESLVSNNYNELQSYYLNNQEILNTPRLKDLAENLANWCNVKMGNYSEAISYLEIILENPPSFQDSVFAILDLNYIYQLMSFGSFKSTYIGRYNQYKLNSKPEFNESIAFHSELLFRENKTSEDFHIAINSLQQGELLHNVPNPFSGNTKIWYKIDSPSMIKIEIVDPTGKIVLTAQEKSVSAGNHCVNFERKGLPSGLYFCNLIVNGIRSDSKKMAIID